METAELADAWIALQKAKENSPEYERLFWASEEIWYLCWKQPEIAWVAIKEILEKDCSGRILENLSAGPLEDLMVYHGPALIQRVEAEARQNRTFASLLGGVWQNSMDPRVWERIQKVWDRRGWDGTPP